MPAVTGSTFGPCLKTVWPGRGADLRVAAQHLALSAPKPVRFIGPLGAFAEREFGSLPKGHQHVAAICSWLCENIDDTRGSSDEETTADESLLKRAGVCRDLAYLGIAFCRALNIPAPS